MPGVGGIELSVPLPLLFFNLVMLAFWVVGFVYFRFGSHAVAPLWTGVRYLEGSSRVRLTSISPPAGTMVAIGLSSIAAYMFVALFIGVPMTTPAALGAWGIVIASAALVYFYLASRAASGGSI